MTVEFVEVTSQDKNTWQHQLHIQIARLNPSPTIVRGRLATN